MEVCSRKSFYQSGQFGARIPKWRLLAIPPTKIRYIKKNYLTNTVFVLKSKARKMARL